MVRLPSAIQCLAANRGRILPRGPRPSQCPTPRLGGDRSRHRPRPAVGRLLPAQHVGPAAAGRPLCARTSAR